MTQEYKIHNKKITIYAEGKVFVNGNFTGLKQWKNNSKRWSNAVGLEIKEFKGMSLEEVLMYKGFI
jgi:hypothetical protein